MIPTKQDTPHVPVTADEIVRDTCEAFKLGVSVVHVHARDERGQPTHEKKYFEEIFNGIRENCPGIIICATTSGRTTPQVEHRGEVLSLHPDMASLTMGSMNFPHHPSVNSLDTIISLASAMRENGIMPELEVFEAGFINTAKYLANRGHLGRPLHFNLLLGSLGSIPAEMRDLTYLVDSLPADSTWSATGIGRFQTQINAAAIIMGGHQAVARRRLGGNSDKYRLVPKRFCFRGIRKQLNDRVNRNGAVTLPLLRKVADQHRPGVRPPRGNPQRSNS